VSRNNIIVLIVFMVIGVLGLGFLVYSSVNMLANTILIDGDNDVNGVSTYSGNGVSFDYPKAWVLDENSYGPVSGTKIVSVQKISSENEKAPSFQVTIVPDATGHGIIRSFFESSNSQLIQNKTIHLDNTNTTAVLFTYMDPNFGKRKMMEINLVKKGYQYLLLFETSESDFDKEKPNFDMILNSFKTN
jgi:hypothetical protein